MNTTNERNERNMAADIRNAIRSIPSLPLEAVRVTVNEDWVCLRGVLNEQRQKEIAEEVVWQFDGVRGVTNLIKITPQTAAQN